MKKILCLLALLICSRAFAVVTPADTIKDATTTIKVSGNTANGIHYLTKTGLSVETDGYWLHFKSPNVDLSILWTDFKSPICPTADSLCRTIKAMIPSSSSSGGTSSSVTILAGSATIGAVSNTAFTANAGTNLNTSALATNKAVDSLIRQVALTQRAVDSLKSNITIANTAFTANAGTNLNTSSLATITTNQYIQRAVDSLILKFKNNAATDSALTTIKVQLAYLQNKTNSLAGHFVSNGASDTALTTMKVMQSKQYNKESTIATNTTGIATAANQTTGNNSLSTIQTNTNNIPSLTSTLNTNQVNIVSFPSTSTIANTNSTRHGITITNTGSSTVYIGNSGVNTSNGYQLAINASITIEYPASTSQINGTVSSGSGTVTYIEW